MLRDEMLDAGRAEELDKLDAAARALQDVVLNRASKRGIACFHDVVSNLVTTRSQASQYAEGVPISGSDREEQSVPIRLMQTHTICRML